MGRGLLKKGLVRFDTRHYTGEYSKVRRALPFKGLILTRTPNETKFTRIHRKLQYHIVTTHCVYEIDDHPVPDDMQEEHLHCWGIHLVRLMVVVNLASS